MKRELERPKKAEERELEKKRRAEQRETERKRRAELRQKQVTDKGKRTRGGKEQVSGDNGLQSAEISSNECAVCLGVYEEDLVDGLLEKEWIQCTNSEGCGKWMHCSSLSTDENGLYICRMCKVTFS